MKTNSAGLELIKHFEGCELVAYRDSVGVWTIGYGHTSNAGDPQVTSGLRITQEQAETILARDLVKYEAAVERWVKVPLNENEFAALVSFTFNLGEGSLSESTLLRLLSRGQRSKAADEFPRWVMAGGKRLEGLVRRRAAERELFLKPVEAGSMSTPLRITHDTFAKARLKPASELLEIEKLPLAVGTILPAYSVRPHGNGKHREVTLLVFSGHFEEMAAAQPLAMPKAQSQILKLTQDTALKLSAQQASILPDGEKFFFDAGSEFQVYDIQDPELGHIPFKLAKLPALIDPALRDRYFYAYAPHVEIEGTEPNNWPDDREDPKPPGPTIKLPGFTSEFLLNGPIHSEKTPHFTWAEATKNGTRIPTDRSVVENIVAIAKVMEEVRTKFGGKPITVNSWYRDPATNRRVGGASRSRHLVGDAVDFTVEGMIPQEVQRQLDPWWGARGGLASASSFTHIDKRNYRARWQYGF